jgi:hypothetical protein
MFIALGVLTAAAAITTVFAYLRARDGYEDETGFHYGAPPPPARPEMRPQPQWLQQLYAVFRKPIAREAAPKGRPEPMRRPERLVTAKAEPAPEAIPVSVR